ncbi:MAG TPA: dienelactone hydrolase family protein [Burkholderiales bacterium]|nr:dienelactone hydrolase family protein [Burkholderiales bacterium]
MNVVIGTGEVELEGILVQPERAKGLVAFAHGSGSSRLSPRNNYVAKVLNEAGIATLLLDLLTPEEDLDYYMLFDISLLTKRLVDATAWLQKREDASHLKLGYFGASTGAAAALKAASVLGKSISAVVSRGGRPDLASPRELSNVTAPTLFIVGGLDDIVIELNRSAFRHLACEKEMKIIPGATHLFEEAGTLEIVAIEASDWFRRYLA